MTIEQFNECLKNVITLMKFTPNMIFNQINSQTAKTSSVERKVDEKLINV